MYKHQLDDLDMAKQFLAAYADGDDLRVLRYPLVLRVDLARYRLASTSLTFGPRTQANTFDLDILSRRCVVY